jgi:hypothetical protein
MRESTTQPALPFEYPPDDSSLLIVCCLNKLMRILKRLLFHCRKVFGFHRCGFDNRFVKRVESSLLVQ